MQIIAQTDKIFDRLRVNGHYIASLVVLLVILCHNN